MADHEAGAHAWLPAKIPDGEVVATCTGRFPKGEISARVLFKSRLDYYTACHQRGWWIVPALQEIASRVAPGLSLPRHDPLFFSKMDPENSDNNYHILQQSADKFIINSKIDLSSNLIKF